MKRKKELVNWLLNLLLNDVKLKNVTRQHFRAGSAYEKVQAGEATDFDVMVFLDISKGIWKIEDDDTRPGFCSIKLVRLRDPPNAKDSKQTTSKDGKQTTSKDGKQTTSKDGKQTTSKKAGKRHVFIAQLLDRQRRLSALKVRKLFTSKIDQVLKRKRPLVYKFKEEMPAGTSGGTATQTERSVTVNVLRKQRGPATTLAISCDALDIPMFTLDIVNCLHANQLGSKSGKQSCDFVAKPVDKTKAFTCELEYLWRRSYSRQESKKFKSIDAENKIHRKVLKIFKILRMNQSQLKCLQSYIYKNVLLFLSSLPEKKWNEHDLPGRFVDMIIALRNCLDARNLPVFFNRKINLLDEYEDKKLKKIMGYLRRIANKGIDGYKELLSLKEKKEMKRIAAAQAKQKKRKRRKRVKTAKTKGKSMKVSIANLFTPLSPAADATKGSAKGKGKKSVAASLKPVASFGEEESESGEDFDEGLMGYEGFDLDDFENDSENSGDPWEMMNDEWAVGDDDYIDDDDYGFGGDDSDFDFE